jgi:hypothetical protein
MVLTKSVSNAVSASDGIGARSTDGLDADLVVDRVAEAPLTGKISLGRLDGDVAKQELMRGQVFNGRLLAAFLHGAHTRPGWLNQPSAELMPYHRRMAELVFEVVQESDGGYCAECLTENIFTEGDTWDDLRKNVLEATTAFFFDRPRPERVRLHLVRDEVLLVA